MKNSTEQESRFTPTDVSLYQQYEDALDTAIALHDLGSIGEAHLELLIAEALLWMLRKGIF